MIAVLLGCAPPEPTPILLFAGAGTSPNDVRAVEAVLDQAGLRWSTASSADLDRATAADLGRHRLLVVPGGNFVDLGQGLAPATVATVRDAVRHGLGYLGICGGAFFAGASPYNGLDLTSGVRFGFYAAEARGVRKASVPVAVVDGPVLDQYWEDGPELSGWGAVVARYPDGAPAVVEGSVGDGWVVLSGVHPEAPESWRGDLDFTTPASVDQAYAATLVSAALDRTWLPHD